MLENSMLEVWGPGEFAWLGASATWDIPAPSRSNPTHDVVTEKVVRREAGGCVMVEG
jgi:hypothetical protein